MNKNYRLAFAFTFIGACSGCTSQQLYNTGQAYQRNQCQQLMDQYERDTCLAKTKTTYPDYKRDTNSGNN